MWIKSEGATKCATYEALQPCIGMVWAINTQIFFEMHEVIVSIPTHFKLFQYTKEQNLHPT